MERRRGPPDRNVSATFRSFVTASFTRSDDVPESPIPFSLMLVGVVLSEVGGHLPHDVASSLSRALKRARSGFTGVSTEGPHPWQSRSRLGSSWPRAAKRTHPARRLAIIASTTAGVHREPLLHDRTAGAAPHSTGVYGTRLAEAEHPGSEPRPIRPCAAVRWCEATLRWGLPTTSSSALRSRHHAAYLGSMSKPATVRR